MFCCISGREYFILGFTDCDKSSTVGFGAQLIEREAPVGAAPLEEQAILKSTDPCLSIPVPRIQAHTHTARAD